MARDVIDPPPSRTPTDRSPMDDRGRPLSETATPRPETTGEPNGPRPPAFDVKPKDEIAIDAAAGGEASDRAVPRSAEPERERDGFFSGMTTPESVETTAGQHPKVVRRTLDGERRPEDRDDRDGST